MWRLNEFFSVRKKPDIPKKKTELKFWISRNYFWCSPSGEIFLLLRIVESTWNFVSLFWIMSWQDGSAMDIALWEYTLYLKYSIFILLFHFIVSDVLFYTLNLLYFYNPLFESLTLIWFCTSKVGFAPFKKYLVKWKPLKNEEKCFSFPHKSSCRSQDS